jgi:uncharacterized protein YndB with AHSA1/START domain
VTSTETGTLAVRKSIVVACDVERAFDVFTRQVGTWWPLHTHSIGGDKITEVVVEEQVGGRIYERHSDGGEGEWGRVLTWEPPASFAMTWYPGHDDTRATRLEVRFAPEGDGTRVDLEHTGWEIFAGGAQEYAKNYDEGWGTVLGYYTRQFEE